MCTPKGLEYTLNKSASTSALNTPERNAPIPTSPGRPRDCTSCRAKNHLPPTSSVVTKTATWTLNPSIASCPARPSTTSYWMTAEMSGTTHLLGSSRGSTTTSSARARRLPRALLLKVRMILGIIWEVLRRSPWRR